MSAQQQIPVRDNVGAALRFVRTNWQFIVTIAAVAAAGQGALLLPGPNLIWMIGVLVVVVAAYTAYTRLALNGSRQLGNQLAADSLRVGAATAMISVFLLIVFIMLAFVTMSVLIGPYSAEVRAAGQDQVAVEAIMNRALAAQPNAPIVAMAIGAVLIFAITTRFYFAAPASVDQNRIMLFESWRLTRGNFLRIAAARLMLLGPAFVLVGALQTLIGMALGAPTSDPIALATYGQGNPAMFAVFYACVLFLQLALFSALEAGLSAYLYRSAKAAPAAT